MLTVLCSLRRAVMFLSTLYVEVKERRGRMMTYLSSARSGKHTDVFEMQHLILIYSDFPRFARTIVTKVCIIPFCVQFNVRFLYDIC